MVEFIEWFRQIVEQMVLWLGYPGITVTLVAELVFPPTPSETVMLFSGFLIEQGALDFWGVLIASTVGVMFGGVLFYVIGLRIDPAIIRAGFARYGRYLFLTVDDYDRAQVLFRRYGAWVVLVSRVLPVVRAFVPLLAGIEGMPPPKFLLFFTTGTVIYNAIYIWFGVKLGENWQTVLKYVDRYNNFAWLLTGLGVVVFIYLRVIKPRFEVHKNGQSH